MNLLIVDGLQGKYKLIIGGTVYQKMKAKVLKDRQGNTIEYMKYGFFAIKGNDVIKVYSEVYTLGIYLHMSHNDIPYNQVSKDTVTNALNLMDKQRQAMIADNCIIEEIPGEYKVKRTPAGYYIKPRKYINPKFLKPAKK